MKASGSPSSSGLGAVLNNGIGNYQAAVEAAQRSTEYLGDRITPPWSAVELIEAAARSGCAEMAADALPRLAAITSASGTDLALGIEARSRALLSEGETAERSYRESIERLGVPISEQTSLARTCCTESGYAGSAAASTRAHSSTSPTTCSR